MKVFRNVNFPTNDVGTYVIIFKITLYKVDRNIIVHF